MNRGRDDARAKIVDSAMQKVIDENFEIRESQPSRPDNVTDLLDERIQMCFWSDMEDGSKKLCWFSGHVIAVSDGKNMKKVRSYYKYGEAIEVQWDDECLSDGDDKILVHPLSLSNFIPKGDNELGWRYDVDYHY